MPVEHEHTDNAIGKADGGVGKSPTVEAVGTMADGAAEEEKGNPEQCQTCRFFSRFEGNLEDGFGECHRLPPAVLSIEPGVHDDYRGEPIGRVVGADVAWPSVAVDDWCGEHRPQPEPAR